jgi:hypothetical protein
MPCDELHLIAGASTQVAGNLTSQAYGLRDAVTESVPSALLRTLLHATIRMLGSREPDRH